MSASDLPAAADGGLSSGEDARVELASPNTSLELSLVASDFRTLASGMGRLSASVPAGIYQVVARAGPVIDRKLIALQPGGVYRDEQLTVNFPASAPVAATITSHEYHQYAAEEATRKVANSTGPPSGLVIVVRDVRGYGGPPLGRGDLACFELFDTSFSAVADFAAGWTIRPKEAVATWSGRLEPGGYALRTDPSRAAGGARQPALGQPFDQSISLSPYWQTVVFITTGDGGPRTSDASIHMAEIGVGWSPGEVQVGQALELASWGLRRGRSVLPDDLLSVLLGTKFVNPMLGIVGAHSLLLRQELDGGLLKVVIDNLTGMMPGHPDVLALRWLAAARGASLTRDEIAANFPAGGAHWPPMLLPSYRALIEMDAAYPHAIADGSAAERIAANLLIQGLWTTWTPLPRGAVSPRSATGVPSRASPTAGPQMGPPMGALEDAGREAPRPRRSGGARSAALPSPSRPTAQAAAGRSATQQARPAAVLSLLGRDPDLIAKVPRDDPATARVAGYLTALAALEGAGRTERFTSLSPQEIGLATTLPTATVERALGGIAAAVMPPASGGRGRATTAGGTG